jgi:hypothetical protein
VSSPVSSRDAAATEYLAFACIQIQGRTGSDIGWLPFEKLHEIRRILIAHAMRGLLIPGFTSSVSDNSGDDFTCQNQNSPDAIIAPRRAGEQGNVYMP